MSKLSFRKRLECEHSYARDDNKYLLCEIDDSVCDGTIYDCCLEGLSMSEQMEILVESGGADGD